MKVFIVISLVLVMASCASNRARKNISHGEITIHGGVYQDKEWSDKLVFERTSWYREASMDYDLLLNKLDDKSLFANWMGTDRKYLSECKDFYVALVYADVNARHHKSFLLDQIEKSGLIQKGIQSFKENLMAHNNYADWRLSQYKIVGFCRPQEVGNDLVVSVPGFKSVKL